MRWTRRPGQEQHRVLRRQFGWEVLAERGSQAQHLTRSLSDRGLMRPSQQLHRIRQVGVPGDLPVMITIQPDDLRQDVRITRVALGAGGGMPLPIPRRGQRVDSEHLIAGRAERRHPRPAIGLDPDEHPTRDLLTWQIRPIRRSMLGDQRIAVL